MEFLSGLLPWLLGGIALIGGGALLVNTEWFQNRFNARPGTNTDGGDQSQQQRGQVRVANGTAQMAVVLNSDNSIAFSAQGPESREEAMHFMENSSDMSLTAITGNVVGESNRQFQVTGAATRRMENGTPVTRRIRFQPSDHHEIGIENNGLLDFNSENARTLLTTLRNDEGLHAGLPRVHVNIGEGFSRTFVLNQQGRAIYLSASNAAPSSVNPADRLNEASTTITGEVDPYDPTKFRISSFGITTVNGPFWDRSSTTLRFSEIALQDRPTLTVGPDGYIDFSSPEVQEQLQQIRMQQHLTSNHTIPDGVQIVHNNSPATDLPVSINGMLNGLVTGGQTVVQRPEGLQMTPVVTSEDNPTVSVA